MKPAVTLLQDGATNLKLVYPEEGSVWLPGAAAIVKKCSSYGKMLKNSSTS